MGGKEKKRDRQDVLEAKREGEKIGSRVARKRLVPNQGGSNFFGFFFSLCLLSVGRWQARPHAACEAHHACQLADTCAVSERT